MAGNFDIKIEFVTYILNLFRALGKVAEIIDPNNKADIVCCLVLFFEVDNLLIFNYYINKIFPKKKTISNYFAI